MWLPSPSGILKMILLVLFSLLVATTLFALLYAFNQHQNRPLDCLMDVSGTQDGQCHDHQSETRLQSSTPLYRNLESSSPCTNEIGRIHEENTTSDHEDKWTVNDLNRVLNIAWEARAKWYHIGLGLGLKPGDLDAIKKSPFDIVDDCFTIMIKTWLISSKDTSREKLAEALKQPTVSHVKLAESIQTESFEADKDYTEYFPHLQSVSSVTLSPQEMTKLKCRLIDDAEKIKEKFSKLVLYVIKSFNRRELAPRTLASNVLQADFFPQLNDPAISEKIMGADSIDRIMLELRRNRCISFFNHHLLEFVIQELGTVEEKKEFDEYLVSFKDYCKRYLFEVPQYLFDKPSCDGIQFALKVSSEFRKSIRGKHFDSSSITSDDQVVKISSETLHLSVNDTIDVLRKLAKILDLNVGSFCLINATPGCTKLVVSIPQSVGESILSKIDTNPGLFLLESSGIHIVSGPPGKPQAIEIFSTFIKLSWTRPKFKRRNDISYAVYFRPAASPIAIWERVELHGPEETITIQEDSSFIFKVCAVDEAGEGAESEKSDEIVLMKNDVIGLEPQCTPEEAAGVLTNERLNCSLRVLAIVALVLTIGIVALICYFVIIPSISDALNRFVGIYQSAIVFIGAYITYKAFFKAKKCAVKFENPLYSLPGDASCGQNLDNRSHSDDKTGPLSASNDTSTTPPTPNAAAVSRNGDVDVTQVVEPSPSATGAKPTAADNSEANNLLHKHRVEKIKIDKNAIPIQSLFLLAAAKNGDLHEVLSLLEDEKTDINYQDPEGMTALHFAAMEGHVEILELLLKNGCNVNVTAGKKGRTPLQLVCLNRDNPSKRRAEMAKLLLDHDTKLYIEDTDGRTPLFAASRSGFVDMVKVILEKVAELPQRKQRRALNHTMMNGWTPIMDAAMHGHAEVIKLLLEAGATVIKTKEDDETALHIAAYQGHVEAIKVLIANQDRFVINARDKYGLTPLMMATSNGKVEAANALLEAGADMNLQSNDKERRTALMFAAKNGIYSIVKLLLKYKPDVNIKDSSNKTAMDLAKTLEIQHCLKVSPEPIKKEQVGVSS